MPTAEPTHRTARPRTALRTALWAVALLAAAAPDTWAGAPAVDAGGVRVGLRGAGGAGRARAGAWAPVFVRLTGADGGNAGGEYRLVVEAADAEDAAYRYAVPVPALAAGQEHHAVAYVRPGNGDVTVRLGAAAGGDAAPPVHVAAPDTLDPADRLFLTVGTRGAGLAPPRKEAPGGDADEGLDRGGRRLAYAESVHDLPDRWFGYDAVDVVVLTTGSEAFVADLASPAAAPRRQALAEWVHRGGRLVVSAGRNHKAAADLLDKLSLPGYDRMPIAGVTFGGSTTRPSLPAVLRWALAGAAASGGGNVKEQPLGPVEVADLLPRPVEEAAAGTGRGEDLLTLVREGAEAGGAGYPAVVQSGRGLGRVVVAAFDLDAAPFTVWELRGGFWDRLEAELLPRSAAKPSETGTSSAPLVLGTELKRGLEDFRAVPVISFGWVALLILAYIALIGPLDYLLLKKVFKRLELTWVTFPAVVLAVSAAAYFTAYALKGDDLRLNKVDVVDVDLHGPAPQAYGTSWLTLFSPRIRNYTVGFEPAEAWVGPPALAAPGGGTAVTVLEGAERAGRTGSAALFRTPYAYAPDASGLEGLAVPVWATRSFTASWRVPLGPGRSPVDAGLRRSRDPAEAVLLGRVINRLPVPLRDVSLVYRGERYAVPDVPPDGFVPVDNLNVGGKGQVALQWLNENPVDQSAVAGPPARLVRDLLFHGPPGAAAASNAGWRGLDQSWRLRPQPEYSGARQQAVWRDEAVLVARVPSLWSGAEQVTKDAAAPTRLWLDALPGTGAECPPLPGYLAQDTYVRVYIPVQP